MRILAFTLRWKELVLQPEAILMRTPVWSEPYRKHLKHAGARDESDNRAALEIVDQSIDCQHCPDDVASLYWKRIFPITCQVCQHLSIRDELLSIVVVTTLQCGGIQRTEFYRNSRVFCIEVLLREITLCECVDEAFPLGLQL